ncbi:rna polymerase sigma-70 ecf-like protein : RNA polymerase sigma-70 ECF-like protein OS=Rhodopirellula sp. SWK7 GN=RRSWK_04777 PE=4 SV=1: Sigma70_ECF [Gemmataceae bacterium]|nr:rna polymerase sigma-70 ecf-like protein : RNA polymerase sigma-70 ECF-like protein OS=Rhodopirellula sp. SWK7 GN=RRSWK_04777 PE=4 SV=1: Sigma70_ECF [Gemmataceae bacterium]VTT97513.1 rna polymerase sigma-70 ecf-like protein : RNA polymerase sigma-70 ECF-like protein OS=Rhodopirellula sp. SWK7 GN=RRSWK_04777 PE=4 SV=1: Sigma70_ECF [Gemmataceae bacterium]
MSDVTQILSAIHGGDRAAAAQLLPLVYDELRRLAAGNMARESAGHTLNATALVHEAYLRLIGSAPDLAWNHRGHFFAAAAESMRRILVDHARKKHAAKRGGARQRVALDAVEVAAPESGVDLLALDEALTKLTAVDPEAAKLVQLRYFSGLTAAQAAECLGTSLRSAERMWAFARAWLLREMGGAT